MQKVKWKFLWLALVFVLALSIQVLGESNETVILSDFDIYEADIRDVFRSLAEIGNMNVLIDPSVKGEATFKLRHGISVKEAIEMIAQTYGYSVRWIPNNRTMLIGNEKTFANFETKETRTYQLNYANVDQIVEALKVVIPLERIGIDKRTNQLTIKASVLEHQNIVEIVERLDQEMPQINIEARVEEISKSAASELGISWPETLASTEINWRNLTFTKPTTEISLKALEEQSKAKLLANPNISTTDSQEGRIFIGDKYPIITSDVTDKGITYKIEYIEIGTILTVTPRINKDDVITVVVKAEVSSIVEWKQAGNNNQIPVIRTREASSVIRLKEGETFVLSGLNMTKNNQNRKGVIGVSRIPILGNLFSVNTTGPNEDTEIVIFLTPKIVRTKPVEKVNENPSISEKKNEKSSVKSDNTVEVKSENLASSLSEQLNTGVTEAKTETVDENLLTSSVTSPQEVEPMIQSVDNLSDVATVIPEESLQPQTAAIPQTEPLLSVSSGYQVKYVVKKNESLAKVAERFGIDAESISQANNLAGTITVSAGKELIIPIPENRIYVLKPKETLWRLAKRYGTTVEVLMELNNITDYTALEIGQQIVLPVSVDQVVDPRF